MTRVYCYRCYAPTTGADLVLQQLERARAYRETLVAIESGRRQAIAAIEQSASPDLVDALAAEAADRRALDLAIANLPGKRSPSREDGLAACRMARLALRASRTRVKAARAIVRTAPDVERQIAMVHGETSDARRDARATCGVYWGTYLLVERAHDASRQHPGPLQRPRGSDQIGVQFQRGLPIAALLAGHDRRGGLAETGGQKNMKPLSVVRANAERMLAALPMTDTPWVQRRRAQLTARLARYQDPAWVRPAAKRTARLRLRVGSDGRDPVWAEWPLVYDRPIPPEARVTWITVQRRPEGPHVAWYAAITVEIPDPVRVDDGSAVAIDLGWRRLADGSLRAGGIASTDRPGVTVDLLQSPEVERRLAKAAEIQSLRDQYVTALRQILVAWRDTVPVLPPAHAEMLARVGHWQRPSRFLRLARWWLTHRCEGDAAVVESLATWREREQHLWWYEYGTRRRAVRVRREQARRLASALARRYATLVIERLNLARLAEYPAKDAARELHPTASAQRVLVAPSVWRQALVNACRREGCRIIEVKAGEPADGHLAAWCERRDGIEITAPARMNRFRRLRQSRAAAAGAIATHQGGARAGAAK